jgi:hypothetical protein
MVLAWSASVRAAFALRLGVRTIYWLQRQKQKLLHLLDQLLLDWSRTRLSHPRRQTCKHEASFSLNPSSKDPTPRTNYHRSSRILKPLGTQHSKPTPNEKLSKKPTSAEILSTSSRMNFLSRPSYLSRPNHPLNPMDVRVSHPSIRARLSKAQSRMVSMKSFPDNERFWLNGWTPFSYATQHQNNEGDLILRTIDLLYRMGSTLVDFPSWGVSATALLCVTAVISQFNLEKA